MSDKAVTCVICDKSQDEVVSMTTAVRNDKKEVSLCDECIQKLIVAVMSRRRARWAEARAEELAKQAKKVAEKTAKKGKGKR